MSHEQPAMAVADGQPLSLGHGDHRGGRVDECAEVAAAQPMQDVFTAHDAPC